MLKQTLIAAATALVLATGSLAVTTGSALADHRGGSHHSRNHDRGWNDRGWDNGPRGGHGWGKSRQVCRPVMRERKVWRHGRWQWRNVVVGERCYMQRGGRGGHHGGPRW